MVLDGIDRLTGGTLMSLASVVERGLLDLPCGERLVAGGGFQCIALGHPMGGEGEGGG